MNETLIYNWNRRVKKNDIVIHNGDFCFRNSKGGKVGEGTLKKASYYINRLNGTIIFIKGNHDRNNSVKTIIEHIRVRCGNTHILIVHNPEFYNISYPINFVAHIHEKWKFKRIKSEVFETDLINIGVDVWDFQPVTFEEIYSAYRKWLYVNKLKVISRD